MAAEASVSDLSSTSSRSEQMAFFMEDLNLDRPTAMLMYRAERLQEKGQLRQALRYFEQVLSAKPDCEEARVNARMIREDLAQQAPQRLPSLSEHSGPTAAANTPQVGLTATAASASQPVWQTADLPVSFEVSDSEEWGVYYTKADLDDTALDKARFELERHDINSPFLTLVQNDVTSYTLPVHDDPWVDTKHKCRAIVRVTFPAAPGVAAPASSAALASSAAPVSMGSVVGSSPDPRLNSFFMAPSPGNTVSCQPEREPSVLSGGNNKRDRRGLPGEQAGMQSSAAAASVTPLEHTIAHCRECLLDQLRLRAGALVVESTMGEGRTAAASSAACAADECSLRSASSGRSVKAS